MCRESLKTMPVTVQKQNGGSDCGLFAIKIVTALCFGVDPESIMFEQSCMRTHLVDCFNKTALSISNHQTVRQVTQF